MQIQNLLAEARYLIMQARIKRLPYPGFAKDWQEFQSEAKKSRLR